MMCNMLRDGAYCFLFQLSCCVIIVAVCGVDVFLHVVLSCARKNISCGGQGVGTRFMFGW